MSSSRWRIITKPDEALHPNNDYGEDRLGKHFQEHHVGFAEAHRMRTTVELVPA